MLVMMSLVHCDQFLETLLSHPDAVTGDNDTDEAAQRSFAVPAWCVGWERLLDFQFPGS